MGRSTIIPNNNRDKLLFGFMVIGIPFAVVWLSYVILPQYHNSFNSTVLYHIVATTFVFLNVFGNLIQLIRIDASGRRSYLPTILKPGWKYCSVCQVNSPPRSYHCFDCNECILKRDHHCRFTGCCVGYHNHRYFIVAIFYIWIGSIYGVWYQWDFVTETLNVSAMFFPFVLIAPHFCWLFGFIEVWGLIVGTLHTLGMATIFMSTYLLYLQMKAIRYGQTQYEMKHSFTDYNLSIIENISEVFGANWYLTFLSPYISSPLIGDGLRFVAAKEHEIPKNI